MRDNISTCSECGALADYPDRGWWVEWPDGQGSQVCHDCIESAASRGDIFVERPEHLLAVQRLPAESSALLTSHKMREVISWHRILCARDIWQYEGSSGLQALYSPCASRTWVGRYYGRARDRDGNVDMVRHYADAQGVSPPAVITFAIESFLHEEEKNER